MNKGFEIWIITSRYDDEHLVENFDMELHYARLTNKDIFEKAKDLNIPKERIVFTNMSDKHTFLKDKNFIFHLDDDHIENDLINKYTNCVAISAISSNWKTNVKEVLKI